MLDNHRILNENKFLYSIRNGMGHSSMSYLQHHHFDEVKLDGSLVKGLMTNTRCREIISSIVYLSKSLEFTIIAEFVETEA